MKKKKNKEKILAFFFIDILYHITIAINYYNKIIINIKIYYF
jgi:hypothetical protein